MRSVYQVSVSSVSGSEEVEDLLRRGREGPTSWCGMLRQELPVFRWVALFERDCCCVVLVRELTRAVVFPHEDCEQGDQ